MKLAIHAQTDSILGPECSFEVYYRIPSVAHWIGGIMSCGGGVVELWRIGQMEFLSNEAAAAFLDEMIRMRSCPISFLV
jgi:hypothetical protein